MTPEHHIEWIAGFSDKTWTIKWLDPNEQPAKNLHIYDDTAIYEYCNLHGLWKK
jgi:superoxide reductase